MGCRRGPSSCSPARAAFGRPWPVPRGTASRRTKWHGGRLGGDMSQGGKQKGKQPGSQSGRASGQVSWRSGGGWAGLYPAPIRTHESEERGEACRTHGFCWLSGEERQCVVVFDPACPSRRGQAGSSCRTLPGGSATAVEDRTCPYHLGSSGYALGPLSRAPPLRGRVSSSFLSHPPNPQVMPWGPGGGACTLYIA